MTGRLDFMPDIPPEEEAAWLPSARLAPRQWLRENLFLNWWNGVLTVVFGVLLLYLGFRVMRFVFVTAEWEIVRRNLTNFMVGRFPREDLWRVWCSTFALLLFGTMAAGAWHATGAERAAEAGLDHSTPSWSDRLKRFWPVIMLVIVLLTLTRSIGPLLVVIGAVAIAVAGRLLGPHLPAFLRCRAWLVLLIGVDLWLELLGAGVVHWLLSLVGLGSWGVGWDQWGGLHLTLFVTVTGIVLALPIGLLAALARRSTLPALRTLSIGYIEFIRGVPLITLLLMGQFMLGFFFPKSIFGIEISPPSDVTRALIAITLFTGAYVAEIVRGGLQAVDRGQAEAALAVGLSTAKVMRFIVLPQALRAVIPAMVGQFISLFKDTSLLTVIGVLDLLNVSEVANAQGAFLGRGLASVTLPFAGLIYWVGSYTMSRESRRLEHKLGVGER
ncbi:MAG: amino acid ABC transporter permease [Actinobacteria bacterium]|nr:amino acid ABC transporter permease [Actinomycetota bacterium]